MNFAARITRCPIPFDPEQGAEARAAFDDLPPEIGEVIAGAGGSSPYLKSLMQREGEWLRVALSGAPEAAFDAALEDLPETGDPGPALRRAKRRSALLVGLADLAGVWPLETVTGTLTRLADLATDRALKFHVGREIARGRLPGATAADLPEAAGAVALAMGKMGAGELNYSSDIDLIMLFDDSRFASGDLHGARAAFIRATRAMSATLSERTPEGYVFRTDLRLRPDPSVTPVILSMAAAERYYESLGRTWERAAHIKARAAAGDIAAGEAYLHRLAPFVWRKHLDFAAIRDAHDMRLKIRSHKGLGGRIRLAGHDMKLGRGGIREIEFFTQTRQLISGGRDHDLRVRGTLEGLAVLAEKGWVEPDAAKTLAEHYRLFREVEHRVQMVHDAQTHTLPAEPGELRRIAFLMGEADLARWGRRLERALGEVGEIAESWFAPEMSAPAPAVELAPEDSAIVARWPGYPACRSTRAAELFARLRPEILTRLSRAARPHEALLQFDMFLKGLPAGVQVFSLFEANPVLIDLIVDIAATSPALAQYLGRNAQVLDAVIGGDFFAPWQGAAALGRELSARLAALSGDYEAQLDAARRWKKEWHFRIGVHHLRGLIGAGEAAAQYSDLAEAVLAALWPVVVAELSRKHGAPPGHGAALVAMGSLGGRSLSAASDLDLIVIYDPAGEEASQGPRPLAARSYYARLTQAMVTALSAPTAEGALYAVDMRLRPSGRQGPVATTLESFRAYQREEAWTWEHLALTRARWVAGAEEIGAAVVQIRDEVLAAPRDPARVRADVRDMRARIAAAKGPGAGALDPKIGPGRMQDIELLAECAVLLAGGGPADIAGQIAQGEATGWLGAEDAATLKAAYGLFSALSQAGKLLTGSEPPELDRIGAGGLEFLLRETQMEDAAALTGAVAALSAGAASVIEAALERDPGVR